MEVVKTRVWTKYGGGRLMLIKEHPDTWYCQSCGSEQNKECPAYMFPLGDNNYIRICSECEHKVLHLRVTFVELKKINRHGVWVDNNCE